MMFGMKKVLSFQDAVVVEVRDVAVAQRWYSEKLGFRYSSTEVEEASVVLGYSDDDAQLYPRHLHRNGRGSVDSGSVNIGSVDIKEQAF
jgi:catechol 2,3-dioxygenase-like lactoylglutathione lyase family enzyme